MSDLTTPLILHVDANQTLCLGNSSFLSHRNHGEQKYRYSIQFEIRKLIASQIFGVIRNQNQFIETRGHGKTTSYLDYLQTKPFAQQRSLCMQVLTRFGHLLKVRKLYLNIRRKLGIPASSFFEAIQTRHLETTIPFFLPSAVQLLKKLPLLAQTRPVVFFIRSFGRFSQECANAFKDITNTPLHQLEPHEVQTVALKSVNQLIPSLECYFVQEDWTGETSKKFFPVIPRCLNWFFDDHWTFDPYLIFPSHFIPLQFDEHFPQDSGVVKTDLLQAVLNENYYVQLLACSACSAFSTFKRTKTPIHDPKV